MICEFDQNMFFMYVYYTVYCHLNPAPLPLEQSRNTNSVLKSTTPLGEKNVAVKVAKEVVDPIMTLLLRTDGDDRSPPEG